MIERKTICPDASICYTCPARRVEMQDHYCKQEVFNIRTSSGALRTRPTNCPKALQARKAEELEVVAQALNRLIRNR